LCREDCSVLNPPIWMAACTWRLRTEKNHGTGFWFARLTNTTPPLRMISRNWFHTEYWVSGCTCRSQIRNLRRLRSSLWLWLADEIQDLGWSLSRGQPQGFAKTAHARRLFGSRTALGRFAPAAIAGRQLVSQLNVMGVDDGRDQAGEALIDFYATRGILHFDAAAFPAN
jgi:hypothetical protein